MTKVMKYLNVFMKTIRARKDAGDKNQTGISTIIDGL